MSTDQTRDKIASHVVRILREEREKRHMSMVALAQRSGLSQAMISYVEGDQRNPTLDTLLRISDALDLNLADVIKRAHRLAGRH